MRPWSKRTKLGWSCTHVLSTIVPDDKTVEECIIAHLKIRPPRGEIFNVPHPLRSDFGLLLMTRELLDKWALGEWPAGVVIQPFDRKGKR